MVIPALLASCTSPATIAVITNSEQPRLVEPIACPTCDVVDLVSSRGPRRTYDVAVLDGHSLPGAGMLGVTDEALLDVLDKVSPRRIVAATCYAAEVGFMSRAFERLERLESISATPSTVGWGKASADSCLAGGGAPEACISIGPDVETYDRSAVRSLVSAARVTERQELKECVQSPSFVRIFPHLLCVDDGLHRALLLVDPKEIRPSCVAGPPEQYVVASCQLRGH